MGEIRREIGYRGRSFCVTWIRHPPPQFRIRPTSRNFVATLQPEILRRIKACSRIKVFVHNPLLQLAASSLKTLSRWRFPRKLILDKYKYRESMTSV